MSSTPSLRLIYFPVRARAEVARMIMNYGSIPYTDDDCMSFFGLSFPEVKEAGKLPTGQLPVLEVGGTKGKLVGGRLIGGTEGKLIAQSGAIDRYLASLVPGLIPSDPVVRAQCDMIRETVQDLVKIQPIANVFKGDKFKEEKEDFFKNTLPSRLATLVKILSTKQYFCGDNVTYCDFAVYHHFEICRAVEPDVFASLPTIKEWMRRIEELSGVKEYLRDRPRMVGIGENPRLEK